MARILSIIAPEKFQEIEYGDSRKALEEQGHKVITASTIPVPTDRQGCRQKADVLLRDVDPDDYDAVLFVGGPGSHDYFDDDTCHKLARVFYEAEKPTAAICAAPVILGRAGLLNSKKATCWSGEAKNLQASGAEYTRRHVEKDGLIITGDGPNSAYDFGLAIAEALKGV